MQLHWARAVRSAAVAFGTVLGGIGDAAAGSFAVREQSTVGQGAAFAGVAAGGAPSSMFWNPATMTQNAGRTGESNFAGIIGSASHSYSSSALAGAPGLGPIYGATVANSGRNVLIPSSASVYQINERLWLGLSINAPFGLAATFPRNWAGAGYAQESYVASYNFTPSIAYKVNEWLSIGAGIQVQYFKAEYDQLVSAFPIGVASLKGTGWGVGWTAGVTLRPTPTTRIGLGYRSPIDQEVEGSIAVPGLGTLPIDLTAKLPGTLTFGLRQQFNERFTFLAGAEWANWSRIGTIALSSGGAPLVLAGTPVTFPFQYRDGWYFSVGGEYIVNDKLTVRGGLGYEITPVTDNVRTPRLPDNDRLWFSAGLSYQPFVIPGVVLDFAYSYIDVKSAPINITATSGNPWFNATGAYVGNVKSHVHIVSLGLRYKVDALMKLFLGGVH